MGKEPHHFWRLPERQISMSINGSISYKLQKLSKIWQCDHIYLIFILYIYILFYKREIWCLANLPPRTCPPLYVIQRAQRVRPATSSRVKEQYSVSFAFDDDPCRAPRRPRAATSAPTGISRGREPPEPAHGCAARRQSGRGPARARPTQNVWG